MLKNSSFEEFVNGAFSGWECSVGNGAKWSRLPLAPSNDAREGTASALLPAPEEGQLILFRQRLPADRVVLGGTMNLQLWGRAHSPGQLQVVVSFHSHGAEQKARVVSNGSGEWEKMAMKFDLPETADPERVELQILVRPGSSSPAQVDEIKLWHQEIAPAYALPESIKH